LTRQDPAAAPAPDLIGRDFTAPAPGQRFVGDITVGKVKPAGKNLSNRPQVPRRLDEGSAGSQ
jgi:hypothetical protein